MVEIYDCGCVYDPDAEYFEEMCREHKAHSDKMREDLLIIIKNNEKKVE